MKRALSFLVLLLFALPGLHAQKSMIELGDKVISLGLGIGNTLYIVGVRYYFTEQFAAFAQLGYGVAYLTLGVSIRL